MTVLRVTGCYFIVNIPIYNLGLLVILGYDREQAAIIVKGQGGNPAQLYEHDIYGGLACHEKGTNRFILHFPDRMPRTVEHFADVQHEIRHLTDYMMEHVGMVYDLDHSSEAYAYLTGFLTEQIYRYILPQENRALCTH